MMYNVYLIFNVLSYQVKLTTERLKKGTAQWFRFANSAHIFFNLSGTTIYLMLTFLMYIY